MKLLFTNCKIPIFILTSVGLSIMLFFFVNYIYSENIIEKDPLNKLVFECGPVKISWWPITHIILYFILGYMFPKCWLPIMLIGILWEIIEYIAGLIFTNSKKIITTKGVQYNDKWWSSNIFDPLFNAFGFLLGVLFAYI